MDKEQAERKRQENLRRGELYQLNALDFIIEAIEKDSRIAEEFKQGLRRTWVCSREEK